MLIFWLTYVTKYSPYMLKHTLIVKYLTQKEIISNESCHSILLQEYFILPIKNVILWEKFRVFATLH